MWLRPCKQINGVLTETEWKKKEEKNSGGAWIKITLAHMRLCASLLEQMMLWKCFFDDEF